MPEDSPATHQPPFDVPSVEEMAALLPQYEFEKLAAFGGMGAVYKAKQASLDRPVAIKILPPEFGVEPAFAERFKTEARAMAKLNHTHIVGVIDFGVTSCGHFYLVMEWVQGKTLHEIIHQGSLPVRKAANLAVQLCDALAYAHDHKILHRDIKPGNIMVNEEGHVKVTDFGLARPITGEAEENPYGTPDYAAPEILEKKGVDQRADIFAAGVVLYEMLTGRVPQHPRRSVTEYAPLSPRWDGLIDKATHSDPAQRFQDARDFRAHIMQLVNQAAQAAAVPMAMPVEEEQGIITTPPTQRRLMMIGATVLGLVVLLTVLLRTGSPTVEEDTSRNAPRQADNTGNGEGKTPKKQKTKNIVTQEPKEKETSTTTPPTPKDDKPQPTETKDMAAAVPTAPVQTPAPAAPSMPPPVTTHPPKVTARDLIQKLEELDPDLVQLVTKFADEWATNSDIGTESRIDDLNAKYIPALQRSLNGLKPEQRDHILSEISHIANREPLNEPAPSWPPALENLRKTYRTQESTIQTVATEAARSLRENQCNTMLAEARKRAEAGKKEAAELAEAVAAELAKLTEPPSLSALKKSAAGTSNGSVSEAAALR